MVWLLLTAFILLGQQYYFLRCDLKDVATENRILQRLAAQQVLAGVPSCSYIKKDTPTGAIGAA
jgi:hypothetical protein